MAHVSKITVVGAGAVGATVAYACMIRGVAQKVAIYDLDTAKVNAQVLDLNHGLQFVPMAEVTGSDDVRVCADSDVIIITAGAKQKPGQTRLDLAQSNTAMCKQLIPELLRVSPDAILLMVSNPVDVLTYVAAKVSGLDSRRVFGSGTVLDSSRFRFLIAERCKVAVQNVHAFIVGEHGDSEVPLWSSASIAHINLSNWSVPGHGKLSAEDRREIFENVKSAAYQIIKGKGATSYAIGLATARIVESILKNENRVLPVTSMLNDYRGISDVCLSVPSVLHRHGVEAVLPVPMNDEEIEGLKKSAETVRNVIREVGF